MLKDNTLRVYNLIGIGIGPFNLGLAALLQKTAISCMFFDRQPEFSWHPGLMLEWSRMQVPFYADLVTLEDPTSAYTYLNFLKETNGLLRHGILENLYPLRSEYQAYCSWVAKKLKVLNFNHDCKAIYYHEKSQLYEIHLSHKGAATPAVYFAENIVVGIGNEPYIPCNVKASPLLAPVLHGSSYLFCKEQLKKKKEIVVVGSGQSAAEVFYDLLMSTDSDVQLKWVTRSDRYFPMEGGPFAFSLSSPDYIEWFYALPPQQKETLIAAQSPLYKGVNAYLLKMIYEQIDIEERKGEKRTRLQTGEALTEIRNVSSKLEMKFIDSVGSENILHADAVVLCTGYKFNFPDFLRPVAHKVVLNEHGYPVLDKDYSSILQPSLFFQNADLYSHGFNSADLGLGPYRNGIIMQQLKSRVPALDLVI